MESIARSHASAGLLLEWGHLIARLAWAAAPDRGGPGSLDYIMYQALSGDDV